MNTKAKFTPAYNRYNCSVLQPSSIQGLATPWMYFLRLSNYTTTTHLKTGSKSKKQKAKHNSMAAATHATQKNVNCNN